jgi:hypothetical protein
MSQRAAARGRGASQRAKERRVSATRISIHAIQPQLELDP